MLFQWFCFAWWLLPLLQLTTAAHSPVQERKPAFVSLQRMDAIADLAALALKYFSEDKYLEEATKLNGIIATSEAVTSVTMELSAIWDEVGSAAYTLTRLAKLIDERDGVSGEFTPLARIIRAMAASSLQRNVYMSIALSDDFDFEEESRSSMSASLDEVVHPNNNNNNNNNNKYLKSAKNAKTFSDSELSHIEQLYQNGDFETADKLVEMWISTRWASKGGQKSSNVASDLDEMAERGLCDTLSAFVLLARDNPDFRMLTPGQKAQIVQSLMNATDAELSPALMKWLLIMETFREDQLLLLKLVQDSARAGLESGRRNSIIELFVELEQISPENNVKNLLESSQLTEPAPLLDENEELNTPNRLETEKASEDQQQQQQQQQTDQSEIVNHRQNQPIKLEPPAEPKTGPIKSQKATNRTSFGSWCLILTFIFLVIFGICLACALYYIRNFRREQEPRLRF